MKLAHWVGLVLAILHVSVFIAYWSFSHDNFLLTLGSGTLCLVALIAFLSYPAMVSKKWVGVRASRFDRINLLWMGCAAAITWVGIECRLVQLPWASEILIVAFLAWLILLLMQWVMRLGYDVIVSKTSTGLTIIFFALSCYCATTNEKQSVLWRYRNHPAFIQAYEWHCLDPENEELRHQVMLEHYRIVLSDAEFESYRESHRVEHRHKNQW
ncbi:MAG: hypothetical protein RLZZ262_757 [Bacteroidota bacterium]|jgi:hypothetical protein